MQIDRVLFALDSNPIFQPFWPLVSELYARVFEIKPTLCFVGTERELRIRKPSTKYGEVIHLERIIPTLPEARHIPHRQRPALVPLAVLYGPTLFPDEVVMTSGIDQFPLSATFFNHVQASKAEMIAGFAGVPEYIEREKGMGCRHVPTSHIVAKGSVFKKVLGTLPEWDKDAERMWRSGYPVMFPGYNNWGIDEAFFSRKLWEAKDVNIDLFSTEFWLKWTAGRLNRPRKPNCVDMAKLHRGEYTELHAQRNPFPDWTQTLIKSFIEAFAKTA